MIEVYYGENFLGKAKCKNGVTVEEALKLIDLTEKNSMINFDTFNKEEVTLVYRH